MKRFFNTTGLCNPDRHYMVDPFRNLYDDVLRLIEAQQYFVIHAPRQTGKTTLLHALAHRLNREGRYVSIVCSLESAGYPSISVEDANARCSSGRCTGWPTFSSINNTCRRIRTFTQQTNPCWADTLPTGASPWKNPSFCCSMKWTRSTTMRSFPRCASCAMARPTHAGHRTGIFRRCF